MNEYEHDQKVQFCEWFQKSMLKDAEFVNKAVWYDEASFSLNGTMNFHSCIYWSLKNLHIYEDKVVNLPGPTAWCRMSSRSFNGSFSFWGTVYCPGYLNMLRTSLVPTTCQVCGNEGVYFQQYHRHVRSYLNEPSLDQRISRIAKGSVPPALS